MSTAMAVVKLVKPFFVHWHDPVKIESFCFASWVGFKMVVWAEANMVDHRTLFENHPKCLISIFHYFSNLDWHVG